LLVGGPSLRDEYRSKIPSALLNEVDALRRNAVRLLIAADGEFLDEDCPLLERTPF